MGYIAFIINVEILIKNIDGIQTKYIDLLARKYVEDYGSKFPIKTWNFKDFDYFKSR